MVELINDKSNMADWGSVIVIKTVPYYKLNYNFKIISVYCNNLISYNKSYRNNLLTSQVVAYLL